MKQVLRAGTVAAIVLAASAAWAAPREKILYSFGGVSGDAQYPLAALTFAGKGNLLGTTSGGGQFGNGAIFELSPAKGGWTERVLYSFTGNEDGYAPQGGLIRDKKGNFYGTASGGGDLSCDTTGCGVVFELSATKQGWSYTKLYQFVGGNNDGDLPTGKLVFDTKGNLYGETIHGGEFDGGVVFELKHTKGAWQESAIYIFGVEGGAPIGGLVFDGAGNLCGATEIGNGGLGTVFELTPNGDGTWTETDLHDFNGDDGSNPAAGLAIDSAGKLYGTTTLGGGPYCFGQFGCGNVFEVSPDGHGGWNETTLYTFTGGTSDGQSPQGVLLLGPSGRLYGTTAEGGGNGCNFGFGCGMVFELKPATGEWKEKVPHRFRGANDGKQPSAGLISDKKGHLYGTTSAGGKNGAGTVFEIVP